MRSHAPDPYSRTRALWPMLRLFARWVIWQHRALAASGLLQGRAARWLSGQLGLVEHGLRCLLVIGAQRSKHSPSRSSPPSGAAAQMRGPTPPRSANVEKWVPVSPASPPNRDDMEGRAPPFERPDLDAISRPLARISRAGGSPWISTCAENTAERAGALPKPRRISCGNEGPWGPAFAADAVEQFGAEQRARAFSLSLSAFNLPPNRTPVIPDAQRLGLQLPKAQRARSADGSSDGRSPVEDDVVQAHPPNSAHPRASGDERDDFQYRLAAIVDVFANSEHHIARMARHLARRGIKLKRRPTVRPSGGVRARWISAAPDGETAPAHMPAGPGDIVPDTS